jgi:hypothetical protein
VHDDVVSAQGLTLLVRFGLRVVGAMGDRRADRPAQPQSTFLVIDDPALAGCRYLDFDMINLRSELPAFYARFGFVEVGTAEMGDRHKLKLECHRITMSKPLRRESAAERP